MHLINCASFLKPGLGNAIIKKGSDGICKARYTELNEKFWDLKKIKQDSMINGSLKVFARYGFRHASTDEIVAEAGGSKGLLFHYIYSKNGLYEFLAEYSARFSLVELNSEFRKAGPIPFFELQKKLTKAESRILRQYPYMLLFIKKAAGDSAPEEYDDILSNLILYTDRRFALIGDASLPETMTAEDAARISGLLDLLRLETASDLLNRGSFIPDKYSDVISDNIQLFERLYMR